MQSRRTPHATFVWIRYVLNEYQVPQRCTLLHQRNAGASYWITSGPVKHISRRKHVDIWHNDIVDLVQSGTIDVTRFSTKDMYGNFLPKTVFSYAFEREMNQRLFSIKLNKKQTCPRTEQSVREEEEIISSAFTLTRVNNISKKKVVTVLFWFTGNFRRWCLHKALMCLFKWWTLSTSWWSRYDEATR